MIFSETCDIIPRPDQCRELAEQLERLSSRSASSRQSCRKQSQATQTHDHHVGRDGRGLGLLDPAHDREKRRIVQDEVRHLVLYMNLF